MGSSSIRRARAYSRNCMNGPIVHTKRSSHHTLLDHRTLRDRSHMHAHPEDEGPTRHRQNNAEGEAWLT